MFIINLPYFSLEDIRLSMQSVRVKRIFGYDRVGYCFFNKEEFIKVEQDRDKVLFSCNEVQFFDNWFEYFDLSTDYKLLNSCARRAGGMLRNVAATSRGLHLLKQDPWEVILEESFFYKKSPKQAKQCLDDVSSCTTESKRRSIKGFGRVEWHPLPTPEQMGDSLDLIEWVCDSDTFSKCKKLVEWSKSHEMLLGDPTSHCFDAIRSELEKLDLADRSIDRIMAHGFGDTSIACVSKKSRSMLEKNLGMDLETVIEFNFANMASKASYVGDIMVKDSVSKKLQRQSYMEGR